jgi:DNA-binding response OmpR family regulator
MSKAQTRTTVLLVEDDDELAIAIRRTLEHQCSVFRAAHVEEALHALETPSSVGAPKAFACAIVDLMLPLNAKDHEIMLSISTKLRMLRERLLNTNTDVAMKQNLRAQRSEWMQQIDRLVKPAVPNSGQHGERVARAARQQKMAVVYLTAVEDESNIALSQRGVRYLTKPVTGDVIAKAIEDTIKEVKEDVS